MLTCEDRAQNRWLSQIMFLSWILSLSLTMAFCYFASSLCITLLLAAFLARAMLGTVVPLGAALLQNEPVSTLAITVVTAISLHVISANLLVPRMIGRRVSISLVAATWASCFWGWLWGLIGVLLACY